MPDRFSEKGLQILGEKTKEKGAAAVKHIVIGLSILLAFSLCGCATLLETSGYEKEPYQEPTPAVEAEDSGKVENYNQLITAVICAVTEHREQATILFQNYEGDIFADMETVCREVQQERAVGAFAVEKFSYEIRRIVSYYEAELTTSYRRTEEQVGGLVSLGGTRAVREYLARALEAGETYLAIYMPTTALTAEQMRELLQESYFQYAGGVLCLPTAEVVIYPEDESVERVFELYLDYGLEQEEKETCQAAMETMIEKGLESVVQAGGSLEDLVNYLTEIVSSGASDKWASTTYGALVEGQANSQGLALAFSAICRAGGLETQVVEGSFYGESRFWNLVALGEEGWGHCDVTALRDHGSGPFLTGDTEMAGYIWNRECYPAAVGMDDGVVPTLKLPEATE